MKIHHRYSGILYALILLITMFFMATQSPSLAANFVQNPGFEMGELGSWGMWNDIWVVDNNQRSGDYALRVGDAPASSEQLVEGLVPDSTYTLSGWAKLGSDSSGEIRIGVKDYGGPEIQEVITATDYAKKSITFKTGLSNTSVKIFCYRNKGFGYAYCDDFFMEGDVAQVPTPTPVPTDTPLAPAIYYVDCSSASTGDGSEAHPWNNLTVINETTFAPGSSILFKRGTTCKGTLWPKGSGENGRPIVVDAYGTGAQPHIEATCADNGVYLYNQQYWELRNLEVSNDCERTSNTRRGVHIHLEDFGTGTYYRVLNLTVHNVKGDPYTDRPKDTGGIIFRVSGSSVKTKFSDVVIDGNTLYTVDRSGINMGSSWWCRPEANCMGMENYYAWDPFIVRNNTLYDVGGDGIVLQYASGSTVEYNVVYDAQARSTKCNAGIWNWNADDVLFQYNEAYNVRLTYTSCDGQGFDIDYGTARTIMQYNYSHDNEGGFMLICGPSVNGNVDSVVRYNISQNDMKHIFHLAGQALTNTRVYSNTIYVPEGNNALIVEEGNWKGYPTSVDFQHNIFYVQGRGEYLLVSGNVNFDHNVFLGNHSRTEPDDPHKRTTNPLEP